MNHQVHSVTCYQITCRLSLVTCLPRAYLIKKKTTPTHRLTPTLVIGWRLSDLYASSICPKSTVPKRIPLGRLMFLYDTQATVTFYESSNCGLHALRHRSQRKSEFCEVVKLHGMYAREIDPTTVTCIRLTARRSIKKKSSVTL